MWTSNKKFKQGKHFETRERAGYSCGDSSLALPAVFCVLESVCIQHWTYVKVEKRKAIETSVLRPQHAIKVSIWRRDREPLCMDVYQVGSGVWEMWIWQGDEVRANSGSTSAVRTLAREMATVRSPTSGAHSWYGKIALRSIWSGASCELKAHHYGGSGLSDCPGGSWLSIKAWGKKSSEFGARRWLWK